VVAERAPNIGIVNSYNDMLSAHAPYAGFPTCIKDEARKPRRHRAGGRRRAGHVRRRDAGHAGHGAVLFSRDVIAMATAVG
jgi:phosphogluconate dehydratase